MKLITRDTDYAIKALIFMAKKEDEITSVTELTYALKVPRPFLRKILQILTRHKIFKSQKGQGGGFLLKINEHIKREDEILYPWIDRGLSTTQVGELFDKFNEAEKNINKEVIEIWFPLRLPILKRQMYCYLLIVFLLLWVIFT